MKNDLEGLINYIDGLAFEMSPENGRGYNDAHQQLLWPKQQHEESPRPNRRGTPVFRDRSNEKPSSFDPPVPDLTATKMNDPEVYSHRSASHSVVAATISVPDQERLGDQVDPTGYQPTTESSSLYFHEESLSMILSQSSVGDEEERGCVNNPVETPGPTSIRRHNAPTPRLLSKVQDHLASIGSPPWSPWTHSSAPGNHVTVSCLEPVANQSTSRVMAAGPTPTPNKNKKVQLAATPNQARSTATATMNTTSKALSFRTTPLDPTPVKKEDRLNATPTSLSPHQDRYTAALQSTNPHTQASRHSAPVDATPRLKGKATRPLSTEDPEEEEDTRSAWTEWAEDRKKTASEKRSTYDDDGDNDYHLHSRGQDADGNIIVEDQDDPMGRQVRERLSQSPRKRSDAALCGDAPEESTPASSKPAPVVTSPESARKLLKSAIQAVQEAREERQTARQWADGVKHEVDRWVEQQRQLIRTESMSVLATTSPTSAATTDSSLAQLEQCISKVHEDILRSNSIREDTDRKLEEILLKQAEQIRSMSTELEAMKEQLGLVVDAQTDKKNEATRKTNVPFNARVGGGTPAGVPLYVERTPKAGATTNKSLLSSTTYSSHSQRSRRKTPTGGYVTDYGNGVIKEVHPDGTMVTRFPNGDVETRFRSFSPIAQTSTSVPSTPSSMSALASPHGIIAYFHAKDGILQISKRGDGSKLFEYANGQVEKHYPDGFKMILFPDGRKQAVTAEGKVIEYPN